MNPRELLQRLMNDAGLNSNSLAARTGGKTKQPQIYRFLTGGALEPKRSTLEPVAAVFGIPVDALFDSSAADLVAAERGWLSGHLPNGSQLPLIRGGASPIGTVHTYSKPKTITWGELMDLEQLPDEFTLAMPDDALAPHTPRGMGLVFDSRLKPAPGAGVLVQAADGKRYVRRYGEGLGDDWEAQARNDAFVTLKAKRDGLVVLAVVTARQSSEV